MEEISNSITLIRDVLDQPPRGMYPNLRMRCRQNKPSTNVYFQVIWVPYWATRKAIILQIVFCSSQMVQLSEPKTSQQQLPPHGLNLQQSGGARSALLQELPSAHGFMETSLIRNGVFSDLLCLISFLCNTWAFLYSVSFSYTYFSAIIVHMRKVYFLFCYFFFKTPLFIHLRKVLMTKTPFSFLFPIIPRSFFFFNLWLAHFLSKRWISHLTLIPEKLPQFRRYCLSRLPVKDWHAMFLLPCQVCVFDGAPRPQREAVLSGHRIRHRKVHADHLHPHCGPRLSAVWPDIFKPQVR